MPRKHEEEEPENNERWLVSYSDFITLLMVMFVVLYSMGQIDVNKYKRLADSMRAAFSMGGAAKVVDAQINQNGGDSKDGKPNPIVVPGIPQQPPASSEVAGDLTKMLKGSNLGSEVSVQTNIEGILISLSEKLVFKTGTAELQQEAFPVLDTIAEMLDQAKNQIRIVGHTDNAKPTDARFQNNWELSVGRAETIAEYLIKKGIKPERMTISGRGEYEPIFANDSDEHRSMNSRADIIVVYNVEANVIGTGKTNIQPDINPSSNP
jgi:chemotaxis protein MotB